MKQTALLFCLILFSLTTFGQKTKPIKKTIDSAKQTTVKSGNEKDEFEKATNQKNATERINALQKFIENFPKSDEKTHALELILSARAEIADEKLRLSDTASGVELFKLAVRDAPSPISDKLFSEVLLQIPTNLFLRGQQAAAIEVAKTIEQKVEGNANQLLGLATFYIGTENGDEAKRLADKAVSINPNLPAAYQTLGLANRLNFQLEDAVNAYARALELDANSSVSKRSLAEMKRATGKTDDAISLYREVLAKDATDSAAQTGLVLSLFDADKRADAEAEMAKALEQNPGNLPLLVGASYWYAAHDDGAKAVDLAQKAIAVEPRYTWAYIALARGLIQQKHPLDAEKALLTARQYGNFPTLDYEIASVRLAAGFYREAAEELKKNFVFKDGLLETWLGGRVAVEAKNFIELLTLERRASIFEPLAADNSENAEKLKSLLNFAEKLEAANASETDVSDAADEFIKGEDKMKIHRQIFIANQLLENKKALPKVLELTKAAVGGVDTALEAVNPSAAILADELYDSRTLAILRGQLIIVPDIPHQTLLSILRGRIEEISGWTLYQQGKPSEAVIRLKRAVSVLPEKSAWWRNSLWQLGTALDADGKSKEALDAYIKSYTNSEPNAVRRSIIETVYQKVNGNLEGLDQKIGANPETAGVEPNSQSPQADSAALKSTAETVVQKSAKEIPVAQISPTPEAKPTTEPAPESKATVEPSPELKATPEIVQDAKKTVEPLPVPPSETVAKVDAEKPPTPDIKIESSPAVLPSPEPNTEKKQIAENQKQSVENQTPEIKSDQSAKPLFEPIIITVPKSEVEKSDVKSIENTDKENPPDKKIASETNRERVVSEKKADAHSEETAQCKITVSQENISLINDGGNLGILVGFEGVGDLKKITGTSNSPNDIEVTFEPEIGSQSGRSFFVIKSISSNKGIFTVTFEAPCGKKDVLVKVR